LDNVISNLLRIYEIHRFICKNSDGMVLDAKRTLIKDLKDAHVLVEPDFFSRDRFGNTFTSVFHPSIHLSTANVTKTLQEINNKVFADILHGKAENQTESKKSYGDRNSVKSEDFGSERSSSFFNKLTKYDSTDRLKRKKIISHTNSGSAELNVDSTTKPLIAKLKSGAKLHNTSESEVELYEGLSRAQRCRLEDQRGTEINFEMPDFLKSGKNNNGNSSSNGSESSKRSSLEDRCEPPPLPPKPKIIPIKPSNWKRDSQNTGSLRRDVNIVNSNSMPRLSTNAAAVAKQVFLEQPTSSFV